MGLDLPDDGNWSYNDTPTYRQGRADAKAAGLSRVQQNLLGRAYQQQEAAAAQKKSIPAPVKRTSGGGTVQRYSGGGGGGGGVDTNAATEAALRSLFNAYQGAPSSGAYTPYTFNPEAARAEDPTARNQLQQQTLQAQSTGANAYAQLQAALDSAKNPYAGQVAQAAPDTANPMAAFMQANGGSTTGTDALRALMSAQNGAEAGAAQQLTDRLGQSWQMGQSGRLQDAAVSHTAFDQSLQANNAAYSHQLDAQRQAYLDQVSQRNSDRQLQYDQLNLQARTQADQAAQARKDDLYKQIMQLAVSGGIDLSKLGITL